MTRRARFRALLYDIFFFGILHTCLTSVLILLNTEYSALRALGIAPLFFLMTIIRRRIRSLALFLLLHIILAAAPLLLPVLSPVTRAAAIFALFCGVIFSLSVRLRSGEPLVSVACVVTGLVLFIALGVTLSQFDRPGHDTLFIVWAFIFLISHIICSQTASVDFSLDILSGAAHQPLGAILRFNNILITVFAVLAAGVSALAGYVPLGAIVNAIGRALLAVIRFIAQLFSREPPQPEQVQQTAPAPSNNMALSETSETHWLLSLIMDILYYAVAAAMLIGITAAIVYSLYRLYRRFHDTQPIGDGDLREYIGPKLEVERLTDLWKGWVMGRSSPAREIQQIRRLYAKKVRRYIKSGIPVRQSDTTGEIYKKLPQREDMANLTRRYDSVRYGADKQ